MPEHLPFVLEYVIRALEARERGSEVNPSAPEWARQLVERAIRATASGLSESYISRIVKGERRPRVSV